MNPLFKKQEFLKIAESFLQAPLLPPDGDIRKVSIFSTQRFSQWLCSQLEQEFCLNPSWLNAHPILLGSWGRQELCLNSDLDVLFVGPESEISAAVQFFNERGYKLRARTPADLNDWSVGVDLFDQLALLDARPLTAHSAQLLFLQQKKIFTDLKKIKKQLVLRLNEERLMRNLRFDSVANYLEPNLKYGPGGLRDLQQAHQVIKLFPELLREQEHAQAIFNYYREFYLTLRNKIHLLGGDDQFFAQIQEEVSLWLGYGDKVSAMRQLQRGLERVHFYSDWVLSLIAQKKSKQAPILRKPFDLIQLLITDPSVENQKKIRTEMDIFLNPLSDKELLSFRKKGLEVLSDPDLTDLQIQAFFRSKLIHYLVPEIKRLDGLVQHDHYHRYTVDTHILQARREVGNLFNSKTQHKSFRKILNSLHEMDRKVLCLLALYHDLGKGLQKDHSIYGAQLVFEDLTRLGFSKEVVQSVQHLTLNHLTLSQAAFRKNPQSLSTWKDLEERGLVGKSLDLLTLWTVVDIVATNAESWNSWKENLLLNLHSAMSSEMNQSQMQLQDFFVAKNLEVNAQNFDQILLKEIKLNDLKKDIQNSILNKTSHFKVFQGQSGVWIRCFEPQDRVGLLRDQVKLISDSGFSIQHAIVQTIPELGAYNWIKIQSRKMTQKQFDLRIRNSKATDSSKKIEISSFHFERISGARGVLIFKGQDQPGFLMNLLNRITAVGFDIQYSQIHTWGQQVEDSFEVLADDNFEARCLDIKTKIQERIF